MCLFTYIPLLWPTVDLLFAPYVTEFPYCDAMLYTPYMPEILYPPVLLLLFPITFYCNYQIFKKLSHHRHTMRTIARPSGHIRQEKSILRAIVIQVWVKQLFQRD